MRKERNTQMLREMNTEDEETNTGRHSKAVEGKSMQNAECRASIHEIVPLPSDLLMYCHLA